MRLSAVDKWMSERGDEWVLNGVGGEGDGSVWMG